jgi:hypothetical protein
MFDSLMLVQVVPITGRSLHWNLLSIICAAPMSHFTQTVSGIMSNRFSQDINTIDSHVPTAVGGIYHSIASIIWDTALVCYGSYYMATIEQYTDHQGLIPRLAANEGISTDVYREISKILRKLELCSTKRSGASPANSML